jgi:hypothetical protein
MIDPYGEFPRGCRVQYVNKEKPHIHGRCGQITDYGGGMEECFVVTWDVPFYHSYQNRSFLMCKATNLVKI